MTILETKSITASHKFTTVTFEKIEGSPWEFFKVQRVLK